MEDIVIDEQSRMILRVKHGKYFVYLDNGEKLNKDEMKYAERIEKLADIFANCSNQEEKGVSLMYA